MRTALLAALAAILALGACAQSFNAAQDGPPTENGIYVARGICFGEGGCPWTHWRAYQPVEMRDRIDANAPVIATIAPGEWVEPIEGQLRLTPRRGIVRAEHRALQGADATQVEPLLSVGDVIYLLEPQGEGEYVIWRRGETLYWLWPDDESVVAWDPPAPDGPTLGWWVRLKRADRQSGWVRDPRFECMGPLAGDENCRD